MWRSIDDCKEDVTRWEGRLAGLQEARLAFYRLSDEQRFTATQHEACENRLIHHELKCSEVLNDRRLELAQAYERQHALEEVRT